VILDERVIDAFRRIDELYFLYLDDEQAMGSEFLGKLRALLSELTDKVNRTMWKRSHTVLLKFRT